MDNESFQKAVSNDLCNFDHRLNRLENRNMSMDDAVVKSIAGITARLCRLESAERNTTVDIKTLCDRVEVNKTPNAREIEAENSVKRLHVTLAAAAKYIETVEKERDALRLEVENAQRKLSDQGESFKGLMQKLDSARIVAAKTAEDADYRVNFAKKEAEAYRAENRELRRTLSAIENLFKGKKPS
jgi:predicted  nucleic acid-binding Zn-ribbon protein